MISFIETIEGNNIGIDMTSFYNKKIEVENKLKWNKEFENPVEINDIIGTFIENNDKYKINMWISIDTGVYINITDD